MNKDTKKLLQNNSLDLAKQVTAVRIQECEKRGATFDWKSFGIPDPTKYKPKFRFPKKLLRSLAGIDEWPKITRKRA